MAGNCGKGPPFIKRSQNIKLKSQSIKFKKPKKLLKRKERIMKKNENGVIVEMTEKEIEELAEEIVRNIKNIKSEEVED